MRALSLDDICERLDDRFRLLASGAAPLERQRTLRSLVDWSHDLLSPDERVLFRRLSVFSGGWTLAAARSVCTGGGLANEAIVDLHSRLVEKSLVTAHTDGAGGMRYGFLETLREYAHEKLDNAHEDGFVRDRHLDTFLALAEQAEPHLCVSSEPWLLRVESERENFRAALRTADASEATATRMLRLVGALWMFWIVRSHFHEGSHWTERAAKLALQQPQRLGAKALSGAARLAWQRGDHEAARDFSEATIAIEDAEAWPMTCALGVLANYHQYRAGHIQ